jgi:hypothetical protein
MFAHFYCISYIVMYSYIYDVESGSWVLSLPSDEDSHPKLSSDKADDLHRIEEHGLLLAIQAAHQSTHHAVHPSLQEIKLSQKPGSRSSSPRRSSQNNTFDDLTGSGSTDDYSLTSFPLDIPPSELFLLVVSIHFINCLINGVFVTLVPIWMVSLTHKGGLDYGVRDCCLAMSATGVLLLLIQSFLGAKAAMALKIFPVRALRIGAGCVTMCSFLLTGFSKLNGISPWTERPLHSPSGLATANSGTWLLWTMNSMLGHTYTVEAGEDGSGGEGLFLYYRPTPASNILSVIIPALLLAVIGR